MRYKYSLSLLYATLGVLFFTSSTWGQHSEIDGRFIEKETKIGATVHYILKLRHSPNLEVVFPDSTYDFSPFELLEKQAFPTRTDSISSLDSVVYTVATYELDSRQGLSLPVFIADPNSAEGQQPLYPKADSIDIEPLITELPDSVATFENTQLAHVKEEFNYPYLMIGLALLFILLALGYALFGNKIRQAMLLRRLKKEHQQFVTVFQQASEGNNIDVEKTISIWKQHTGYLLQVPMASYTTKEVARRVSGVPESVLKALRKADQAIYAGIDSEDLLSSFRELRQFTEQSYLTRVADIKSGGKTISA